MAYESTKSAILAAASHLFTARGFSGVSLRGIASEAHVDVALVSYYFRSKANLFREAMGSPVAPDVIIERIVNAPTDQLGETLVREVLHAWTGPEIEGAMRGVVERTVINPVVWENIGEYVRTALVLPVVTRLHADNPELRATLALGPILGFVVTRYLFRVPGTAEVREDLLIEVIGRQVQEWLTGPLDTQG